MASLDLWRSLLDAQMNARYWSDDCRLYCSRDKWAKIGLALASSGTVAAALAAPILWKFLSGLAAICAVALPFFEFSKKIASMSRLAGEWKQIEVEYEILWSEDKQLASPAAKKRFAELKKKEAASSSIESTLPYSRKRLERCAEQVLRAWGLQRPMSGGNDGERRSQAAGQSK